MIIFNFKKNKINHSNSNWSPKKKKTCKNVETKVILFFSTGLHWNLTNTINSI